MSQELLRALNENRVFFDSAGMTEDVKAVDAKIAAVQAELEAAKPAPKEAELKKPAAKKAKAAAKPAESTVTSVSTFSATTKEK